MLIAPYARYYEQWLDEKIPALSGKTPRQAVKWSSGLINTVIAETKLRAIRDALTMYVNEGHKMSRKDLLEEEHRSERLGRFLRCNGYSKPNDNFEAHALVSGGHARAKVAREILAQFNASVSMSRPTAYGYPILEKTFPFILGITIRIEAFMEKSTI
jgi:hypothetical protein